MSDESEKAILRIREYLSGGTETAVGAWFADKNALRLQKEAYKERGEELIKNAQEIMSLETQITALQEQMSRLAEQHAKVLASAIAEAREEQREACALAVEVAGRDWQCSAEERDSWTRRIRATPLDSTPLAARIAELEHQVEQMGPCPDSQNENACGSCPACREITYQHTLAQRVAAESALAAEVERHQATAQDAADLRMMLSAWESGDLRPGYIAATEEAIEGGTNRNALAAYVAALPAGPRVVR